MNRTFFGRTLVLSFGVSDDEADLKRQIQHWQGVSVKVLDDNYHTKMTNALKEAWEQCKAKEFPVGQSSLDEAIYNFNCARKYKKVYFYAEAAGIWIPVLYLIISVGAGLGLRYFLNITLDSSPLLVPIFGGFLGGIAAVLSSTLGLQVDTQAITARTGWVAIKPALGAILGFVTYAAVAVGLSMAQGQKEPMAALPPLTAFLVGFLGGYLESFSTRVLNDIANREAKGIGGEATPTKPEIAGEATPT
jgi:hypothetical protein